jgi:hypothetical protein
MKVGLYDHVSSVCLYVYLPVNFRMPEPIFMKLGMYIIAPVSISTAYFINSRHQSVCPPISARQRLSKHIPTATNNFRGVVFHVIGVLSEESTLLVISK